jgi:hypothetical protein
MAREVKMPYDFVTGEPIYLEKLKAFEALVRADERNRTWTQEHWTEYERSIAAVERDACAKVCDDKSASYSERASRPEKVRDINPEVARIAVQTCGHVAAAIRARGQA